MKSKKLISFLCAAALTVSSFAGLTISASAAAGDKIGNDLLNLNFNSTANFATADPAEPNYDGVLANGTNAGSVTATILTDGTAVKTVGESQTAALTLVTGSRGGNGDRGWYTDSEGTLVKTGSYYSIEEKTAEDKYLHMSFPQFGDFENTSGFRWAHVDFPATYTATAEKDYVVEFKAKFTSGTNAGVVSTENPYNPVLRLGTFDTTAHTSNAVAINKRELNIGDDWVTVKAVTSLKGTKVYLNGSETYSATSPTTVSITGFGLYSEDGKSNISPPLDTKSTDPHTLTPVVDIDDLVIYESEPEKEADVTIKYVDETDTAIEGKADVTLTGIVGKQFTVPASYTIDFNKDDDQYYTYTSGGDTPLTISETAASNIITLKFTATNKPVVTFKAVAGNKEIGTITTAKGMPGETVTATDYAHAYMQDSEEKWYEKVDVIGGPRGNIPTYNLTATVGSANSTVNVAYKPAYDVVEFIEAEGDETAQADTSSTYSSNYPKLYASGGQWRKSGDAGDYVTGFYTSAVEKAGTYEISVRSYGPDKRSGAIGVLDREGKENKYATKIAELNTEGINITTATADLEAGNLFWVGKNSADMSSSKSTAKKMDEIDYIVVRDTALDAAPAPVVELEYARDNDKTATIKVTNMDEVAADVPVTLIHSSYNNDGTLKDVKVYPVTVAISTLNGTTATATQALTETVAEGDKLMVWDSLNGLKPLVAAHPITSGEADSDTPPQPEAKKITFAADGFTVKRAGQSGDTVIQTGEELAAGDIIKIEATDPAKQVKTVTAGDAVFTVTNGVATYTVPTTPVDVAITAVELENKTVPRTDVTAATASIAKEGTTLTASISGVTPSEAASAFTTYAWSRSATVDGTYTPVEGLTNTLTAETGYFYKVAISIPASNETYNIYTATSDPVEVPVPTYEITVPTEVNTVTINSVAATAPYTAKANDTVTFKVTIPSGKKADGAVSVNDADTSTLTGPTAEGVYTFTMPAKAVTVTVPTRALGSNAVTFEQPTGATVSVTAGSAVTTGDNVAEDQTVSVSVNVDDKYTLTALKYDDGEDHDITDTKSFTMPNAAVTITATVTPKAVATVEFVSPATSVNADTTQAYTVKLLAEDGTDVTSIEGNAEKIAWSLDDNESGTTLTPSTGVSTTVTVAAAETVNFKVIATYDSSDTIKAEQTVEISAATLYDVTTATVDGGTITVDKSKAEAGDTITVTLTPDTGYEAGTISTTPAATVDQTAKTFTMPASAVEVSATFTKVDYSITNIANYNEDAKATNNGTVTADATTYNYGDTVTLTVTPISGYKVTALSYNDGEDKAIPTTGENAFKFTMPAYDVTVTVTFKLKKVTVSFKNTDETEAATAQQVTYGQAPAAVAGPDVANKVFKGWSTDKTAENIVEDITKVNVTADTTYYAIYANTYAINIDTVSNGTITKTAPTADRAEANTDVTFTVVADDDYKITDNSIKVTYNDGTDDQEITTFTEGTSGDNTTYTFKMPAADATITAAFELEDTTTYTATLAHTADSSNGSAAGWGNGGQSKGLDQEQQHVNAFGGTYDTAAYIEFTGLDTESAVVNATLKLYMVQGGRANTDRPTKVYYMPSHPDLSTLDRTVSHTAEMTEVTSFTANSAHDATPYEIDVTDIVNQERVNGKIVFGISDNAGGADIYGKGSADKAPVLTITKGAQATFNITDETAKAAGDFVVTIKQKDEADAYKTVTIAKDSGTASIVLPYGEYTYEVAAANGYKAIEATALDLTEESKAETLSLTAYQKSTATFAIKVGDAAPAADYTIPVVVKGGLLPTAGQTVTTTAGAGTLENLIPGTYTYSIAAGTKHAALAEDGTFTVTEGQNPTVNIELEALAETLTAIGVTANIDTGSILTVASGSKPIGTVTATEYSDAEKTTEMVNKEGVDWSVTPADAGVAVDADGNVTVSTGSTAQEYTITATGRTTTTVSGTYELTLTDGAGTENLLAYTDDFNDTDTIFGTLSYVDKSKAEPDAYPSAGAAYILTPANGNFTNPALVVPNTTASVSTPVAINDTDCFKLSFTNYNPWYSNDQKYYHTISLLGKNSKNEDITIASFKVYASGVLASTTVGTTTKEETDNISSKAASRTANGFDNSNADQKVQYGAEYNAVASFEVYGNGNVKLNLTHTKSSINIDRKGSIQDGIVAITGFKIEDNVADVARSTAISDLTASIERNAKQTVTFNVSKQNADSTNITTLANIPIVVTDKTYGTVYNTATADNETGVATIDLLPGSYSYAIAATDGGYRDASGDFTVEAAAVSKDIALEDNSAARASLTIKYTTAAKDASDEDKAAAVVAGADKKVYDAEDADSTKVYVGDDVEASVISTAAGTLVTADNTTPADTFKRYIVDTDSLPTAATTLVADTVVYVSVTTNDVDYYYYEDFEGTTSAFTLTSATMNAYGDYSKIAQFGTSGGTLEIKPASAITLASGKSLKISFDVYHGYNGNSDDFRTKYAIKNSKGEDVFYAEHNPKPNKIVSLILSGVSQTVDEIGNFGGGKGPTESGNNKINPGHIDIIVNADGSATATLTHNGSAVSNGSFNVATTSLTAVDIASFEITSNTASGRAGGIDNFIVELVDNN